MGLFSPDILQQQQAASSGFSVYPSISGATIDARLADEFTREALNTSNAYVLYTTASTNSGTAVPNSNTQLLLTTDTASSDDVSVRTSGLSFSRDSSIDSRSIITVDFSFKVGETTNTEGFVGIISNSAALTALPTTARHMGIKWDRSVSANFFFTTGNNSAQATTDTGQAISTSTQNITIEWTGDDVAIIRGNQLGTVYPTPTHTATTLEAENFGYLLHIFIQTETTAARTLTFLDWRVKIE